MLAGRLLSPPVPGGAPTIEQLQRLATLITSRVVVNDVATSRIAGYTGELHAAVIVRGDALLGVDLTMAQIQHVDKHARTGVIVLPQPHVMSARVDHERSSIFSINATGLWALLPTDTGRAELLHQALRHAQRTVKAAAGDVAAISHARQHAEHVICSFFAGAMGWSIQVRWEGDRGMSADQH